MRKFIAGQSLDPVEGHVYAVAENNDTPDSVILFKEKITEETAATHPTDTTSKVEFVNKILADKGLEALTAEEIQFVSAQ